MSEAFSMDEDAAAEAWHEEAAFGAFFEQVAGGAAASGAPATAGASAPFPFSRFRVVVGPRRLPRGLATIVRRTWPSRAPEHLAGTPSAKS